MSYFDQRVILPKELNFLPIVVEAGVPFVPVPSLTYGALSKIHHEPSGIVLTSEPVLHNVAPLPELMDRKKRDIMERKGDKEDENKRQKQQKESSAAAL